MAKINKILPLRLPVELAPSPDYNTRDPVGKPEKAAGTIFLGNTQREKQELWCSGSDILTHGLVIGKSGSGKTETLLSIAVSTAFCNGAPLLYVDAKAAVGLLLQFQTFAQYFGRSDDVRIINYQLGGRKTRERHWERTSNSTNPFAQGTPIQASNTLLGLLPAAGGDAQYFKDRAISILSVLMPALCELRDKGVLNLYPSLLSDFINLKKTIELSKNIIIVPGDDTDYSHVTLSKGVVKSISMFLSALPGYDPDRPAGEQPEEVTKQFGFAEGYFSRSLTNLSGQYGHIFQTELGEADFRDVIMNNRILIVAIPGSETMPEETAALGKVVLAAIRTACAIGLGAKSEGEISTILGALPIDLARPSTIIVDEMAEVAVEGFSTILTQGRGLGVSCYIGNQDLAGLKKASEIEAQQMFGNTNYKYLMTLSDAEETFEAFRKYAGQIEVTQSSGWEHASDSVVDVHKHTFNASITRVDAIDVNDLKAQGKGEAHLFQADNIHRINTFYHGLSDKEYIKDYRYNRMLKLRPPPQQDIDRMKLQVMLAQSLEWALRGNKYDCVEKPAGLADFSDSVQEFFAASVENGDSERWAILAAAKIADDNVGDVCGSKGSEDAVKDESQQQEASGHATNTAIQTKNSPLTKSESRAAGDTSTHITDMLDSMFSTDIENDTEKEAAYTDSDTQSDSRSKHDGNFAASGAAGQSTETTVGEDRPHKHPDAQGTAPVGASDASWIFSHSTSNKPIGEPRRLYESLVSGGSRAGLTTEEASATSQRIMSDIESSMTYPTKPVAKTTEREVDKLLSLIRKAHDASLED
ncbi:type IV secretory system conjugative DNA transfer family protein [Halioglobus sp. HI00S01]|uniref:type IV secretory system conjugative DNA transfer family protein n=1 Tax=Halioglobus sp. HI00S01 TaxID=1822214 RepID=UPI001E414864|nr:TraM recognition domain-containing protein [Halioglobus sp. HI00S01]